MRSRDPETGYIARTWKGTDYGPDVRCTRCGASGMWRPRGEPDPKRVLCLRCADDWHDMADPLFKKYGWKDTRSGHKKWAAAFNEFLQTKPKEIDIQAHNERIERRDSLFFKAHPHLRELCEKNS